MTWDDWKTQWDTEQKKCKTKEEKLNFNWILLLMKAYPYQSIQSSVIHQLISAELWFLWPILLHRQAQKFICSSFCSSAKHFILEKKLHWVIFTIGWDAQVNRNSNISSLSRLLLLGSFYFTTSEFKPPPIHLPTKQQISCKFSKTTIQFAVY